MRALAASFFVLAAACGTACGGAPARPFAAELPPTPRRFVVVGDLQHTAPVLETGREHNDRERLLVIGAIAAEHPDLVVVTGDCVFDGSSADQWRVFDRETEPIRAARIPVVTAFGNHEYWRGGPGAEPHVFARFPIAEERHWFAVRFGALRILVLDSNDLWLGPARWNRELAWYKQTLHDLDQDPSVRGVVVAFHHPPFTNSTVTSDEPVVARDLVPPFEASTKTLAMLNGHVHSYERFERAGKTYVVSGGGGGPRARLASGVRRRHPDDLFEGPDIRDFHFTSYSVDDAGVHADVRGVTKNETRFHAMDRFDLPWPR